MFILTPSKNIKFLLLACAAAAVAGSEKGAGVWYVSDVDQALADANVAWYYTWSPNTEGITTPNGVDFVPMIHDASELTDENFEQVQQYTELLGFNEVECLKPCPPNYAYFEFTHLSLSA